MRVETLEVATLVLKAAVKSTKVTLHGNNVAEIFIGHVIRADVQSHKQTDGENAKQS